MGRHLLFTQKGRDYKNIAFAKLYPLRGIYYNSYFKIIISELRKFLYSLRCDESFRSVHAPESFVSKSRRNDRANCPIAVTAITSVQLHQKRREDLRASEREPDANSFERVHHPEARGALTPVNSVPRESGRDEGNKEGWERTRIGRRVDSRRRAKFSRKRDLNSDGDLNRRAKLRIQRRSAGIARRNSPPILVININDRLLHAWRILFTSWVRERRATN